MTNRRWVSLSDKLLKGLLTRNVEDIESAISRNRENLTRVKKRSISNFHIEFCLDYDERIQKYCGKGETTILSFFYISKMCSI